GGVRPPGWVAGNATESASPARPGSLAGQPMVPRTARSTGDCRRWSDTTAPPVALPAVPPATPAWSGRCRADDIVIGSLPTGRRPAPRTAHAHRHGFPCDGKWAEYT